MEAGLEVASFDINFTSLLTCTAYEVLLVKGGGAGNTCPSLNFKYGHYFYVFIRSRLCPCRYLTHLNVVCHHFIQSHVAVSRPGRLSEF